MIAQNTNSTVETALSRAGTHERLMARLDRPVPEVDLEAAENAARNLLIALGEDVTSDGMADTPRRVAKSFAEMMSGRSADPAAILARRFQQESEEVVILRDITFHSLCEHHLLPFVGKAHVAYLPGNGEVVGLSKLARLVEAFARRPQIQERMTNQIADALAEHLHAAGAAVVIEAEHYCMKMRGVCQHGSTMQTSALRGCFVEHGPMRAEILSMLTGRSL